MRCRLAREDLGGHARVSARFSRSVPCFHLKPFWRICSEPLFIFDLSASVGDVKWAPYSSTVLTAVTSEGKVFVFDINVNKYRPICVQQVVPRKNVKLTRVAFNQKIPFIIAGDDKYLWPIYQPIFQYCPIFSYQLVQFQGTSYIAETVAEPAAQGQAAEEANERGPGHIASPEIGQIVVVGARIAGG